VAVSRSRRLIILVGDTSTLRGGYFHHLVTTAGSVGHIVPAPKLIGQLLHRGRRRDEQAAVAADGAGAPGAAPDQERALATGGRRGGGGGGRGGWERGGNRFRLQKEEQTGEHTDQEGVAAAPRVDGVQTEDQSGPRRRRRRGLERDVPADVTDVAEEVTGEAVA